jgi:hypothetical protein
MDLRFPKPNIRDMLQSPNTQKDSSQSGWAALWPFAGGQFQLKNQHIPGAVRIKPVIFWIRLLV